MGKDLYDLRVRAYHFIDKKLRNGTDIELIKFDVGTLFGLSDKFVDDRVKRIKRIAELNKTLEKENDAELNRQVPY